MTQLGDFVPTERDFREEDLPALDHDFFALGVVLQSTAVAVVRPVGLPSRQRGRAGAAALTEYSREVRLMKRRNSSPPEETATEESTRDRVSMAARRLLRRPWMVSPGERQSTRSGPGRGGPRPAGGCGGPGLTSVPLEEAQQRADGGHGRGDVGVIPELRPEDDDLSLLVIVIDTNPIWWGKKAAGEAEFTLSKCIDAAMVLGNSHLFMSRSNRLAVIASHTQESRFLYPGKCWALADVFGDGSSAESNCASSKDGKYELLTAINDAIAEEIKDLMTKTDMKGQQTETLLAGSLAKALCYINKMSKEVKANQEMKSRILVIKAAEDSALQYMNFMNVIFAAQKQSILIDACVLDSDSGLLQQACDITGGIYLKVPHMSSLLQYLLWVFLPDQEQRSQLVLPPPIHVDYRAACFCHRNLIEIGYVCSVCLSIFCNFSPICSTCETAFKISLPPVMKAKKKKLKLSS
ncbi:general transcription factor IIH subunit 3 isoform X2 [Colius striatus]|nr:general transcription factor IIH subunit 3 isoform X2 [Colius striatus]